MNSWHLASWQVKPIQQAITYPDSHQLAMVLEQLRGFAALINAAQIDQLTQELAYASQGERWVLQAGDCAELFSDCSLERVQRQVKLLQDMQHILAKGLKKPVVLVGRIAGQYAKPRTFLQETYNGMTLPSYRGDLVNSPEFHLAARTPDPKRLLQGYTCAAATLHHLSQCTNKPIFTSHEALHLWYEQALTRQVGKRWYNLAAHYPWIGMRTNSLQHAHIEYIRGIANPIAVKIGPATTPEYLTRLVEVLNPARQPGRLTLVHRLGVRAIAKQLPILLQTAQRLQQPITWLIDPMHGNTRFTQYGFKTRDFSTIHLELEYAFAIHRKYGVPLAGVHLELSADEIAECVDARLGITEENLSKAYRSPVDPRLNSQQSIALAEKIIEYAQTDSLSVVPGQL